MAVFTQLRLLLWKSAKVAWRSRFYTALEILLPLIVIYLLHKLREHFGLQACAPVDYDLRSLYPEPVQVVDGQPFSYTCDEPNCAEVEESLSALCQKHKCKLSFNSRRTNEKRQQYHLFHRFNRTALTVTTFGAFALGSQKRQKSSENFFYDDPQSFNGPLDALIGSAASDAANLSTRILFGRLEGPQGQNQECPYLLYTSSVVIGLAFVPMLAAINVAREIAVEKESGMKDYLLVMGMHRGTYYAHHAIWALLKSAPAIVGISVMMIIDSPLLGLHFLLAFLLFVGAEISLAMIIPAVIKRPTVATLCAFVLIPYNSMLGLSMQIPRTNILHSAFASLNPGHAMFLAFDSIREALIRNQPVLWFAEAKYVLTYGELVVIMIFDIVLYVSLAMLIDIITSSSENVFERCKRSVTASDDDDDLELNVHEQESNSDRTIVDVELIDVHKTYSSGERAVKGVSMKLLRGKVTVLLGHNGAGKSTTFAMIAGIIVPTKGTIRFGNGSTKDDRSSIGYCPQYNPVFPKLTVSEHLEFFAVLKGLSSEQEYTAEGKRLMGLLLLTEKENERAVSLSGGMKRKLSIAISLIGNSRIVLLDEPTAGIDAGSRRDIERLLGAQKKERTFLLTTHYTDEAEHLGDRIMIMAGGKLVCSGTPHFLHREFGAGYILTCVTDESKQLCETAQRTMRLVEELVGGAKLERQHGHQFEIWLDKARSERFPELFRALEEDKDALGIVSYGLSNNTLEQVFLRVGELTGVARQAKVKEALEVLLKENKNRSTGPASYLQRFRYMQYKRFLYELCEWKSALINLLPILVVIYSIYSLMGSIKNIGKQGEIVLNDESLDMLEFPECFRVGVQTGLNITESLRSSLSGSCVEVEEAENLTAWYYDTAISRRPTVLATVWRHRKGLWVRIPRNAKFSTSALHVALIRALTNTSFSVSARYTYKPAQNKPQVEVEPLSEEQYEKLSVIWVAIFMIVQPILMYRSIGFYVVERTIKFAHQQLLTGLPRWAYWLASFCSDLAIFLIYYSFAAICCIYFDVLIGELWSLTPLCLLIFCISQAKCYIFQRLFESKSKAENLALTLLVMCYFVIGPMWFFRRAISMVESSDSDSDPLAFTIDRDFPLILDPHVAVVAHYMQLALPSTTSIFATLLAQLAWLILVFVLLEFTPIFLLNRRHTAQAAAPNTAPLLENGVRPVLEVSNLVKQYGNNKAVNGITLSVEQHECFGLLGVNGAGKTTTFEVLTGSAVATSGSATVAGVDCATPARIGYCPQFDALMQELSGRQDLLILAALHGYRNPFVVADTVIECVGMSAHANKKSKSYSGGQRRKISVAAALLAQNSLIILDEPTAGIDPVTRRDIWSVVCALRDSANTAIMLSSHSMEEVEALCSRLAILRTGEIVAQGTSQSLKSAYGNNYKLALVIGNDKTNFEVEEAVRRAFPQARAIKGDKEGVHEFEIPRNASVDWSTMFDKAILLAKELNARDYCLSQASLEDAFIALTSGEVVNTCDNDAQHNLYPALEGVQEGEENGQQDTMYPKLSL